MLSENQLASGWYPVLKDLTEAGFYKEIRRKIVEDLNAGKTIYPPMGLVMNAFRLTPFDSLSVVIIGQDPYHNPGQAHGLAFSVPEGVVPPPSLKNIYTEIQNDIGTKKDFSNGCLESWCRQGVLLLNASLTVRATEPGSHANIGWQTFTDEVIKRISSLKDGIVFMLWGNYAKSKKVLIDSSRHLVLEAAHPSPLARGAFFGCRHFSKCNEYLVSKGKKPIEW